MLRLNNPILFVIQFVCLILATTVAGGGGQFPGNSATWIVYLKFVSFLLPIMVSAYCLITGQISSQRVSRILHDEWILLCYFALILLSVPLSISPLFSLQRGLYTIFAFFSLFSLFLQIEQFSADFYKKGLVALVTLLCLFLILAKVKSSYAELRYAVQLTGLVHPNMISSLLGESFLAVLFLMHRPALKLTLLTCLFAGIVYLQSRGVWISLGLSLVFSLACRAILYQSKNALLALLGISTLAFTCAIAMLLKPVILADALAVFTRGGTVEDLRTLTHRTELWQLILNDAGVKEILIGHGYALMAPSIIADFGSGILFGAHNGYLSIMLGSGLFSLLVWMAYWLNKTMRIYESRFIGRQTHILLAFSSMFFLFIHACVAEEFGLHLTPTVILVLFNLRLALTEKTA